MCTCASASASRTAWAEEGFCISDFTRAPPPIFFGLRARGSPLILSFRKGFHWGGLVFSASGQGSEGHPGKDVGEGGGGGGAAKGGGDP